MPIMLMF